MRYIGGKGRLAKSLSETILNTVQERTRLMEPFMGGAAVTETLAPYFTESWAGDISPDLMMMWQAIQDGWVPPDSITEDEYQKLRYGESSALRGLAGFGGSFGGKWFRGYARGGFRASGEPRNHFGESVRSVLKTGAVLRDADVNLICADYREWRMAEGDVVYCDPPYAASTSWKVTEDKAYSREPDFDVAEFWSVAAGWADSGAHVFVSEYVAPDGWSCVWEKDHRVSLKKPADGGGRQVTVERLFTLGVYDA